MFLPAPLRALPPAAALAAAMLLAGCETRQPAAAPPAPPVAAVAVAAAPPDTIDYTIAPRDLYERHPDTLIQLGSRHYWLQTRQVTDSTKAFDYGPTVITGRYFAAPSDTAWQHRRVRGYDGTYTFTLCDSTRHRVLFTRQLHKRDLLPAGPAEMVTVSEPDFYYVGYSAGLHALLFVAEVGIPNSDVGHRAALLLDARTGRLLALHSIGSSSFGVSDCDPQVAPDGQAVLTCANELLRPSRPPLSLRRPHAEVQAARFLSDTTLLVVYAFGDYRPRQPDPDLLPDSTTEPANLSAGFYLPPELVSTPAQQRAPNAFLYGTSGRVLARFKYDGWQPSGMDSEEIPRHFAAATRTYYLVSEGKDLVLLPRARPGTFRKVPIHRLPRFRPPRRPQEIQFTLYSDAGYYTFYVDKTRPQAIRYQLKPLDQ